jgi:hypothetical protein
MSLGFDVPDGLWLVCEVWLVKDDEVSLLLELLEV